MSFDSILGLTAAALLSAYLLYALIKPERF